MADTLFLSLLVLQICFILLSENVWSLNWKKVQEVQSPPFMNKETEVREVKPCSQCHGTEVLTFYLVIVLSFDTSLEILRSH